MQSFVAWQGEVPSEAKRLEDFEVREHATTWIRCNIGVGVVHSYVIGYELGDRWWTLFFRRADTPMIDGAEVWQIEAYDYRGKSWSAEFLYWPELSRWRHILYQRLGDDHGRYLSTQTSPVSFAAS